MFLSTAHAIGPIVEPIEEIETICFENEIKALDHFRDENIDAFYSHDSDKFITYYYDWSHRNQYCNGDKITFDNSPLFRREVSVRINFIEDTAERGQDVSSERLKNLKAFHQLIGSEVTPGVMRYFEEASRDTKEACGNIDYRSKMPPVRDQGMTGWCYAYAVADLVSFKSGKNISAVDIAVNNNKFENVYALFKGLRNIPNLWNREHSSSGILSDVKSPSDRHAGTMNRALERTQWGGFCLESDLPSDSYETARIEKILDESNRFDQTLNRQMPDEDEAIMIASQFCAKHGQIFGEAFSHIKVQDIVDVIQDNNKTSLYLHLSDLQCKNRVNINGEVSVKTKNELGSKSIADEVNNVLESGNIIGIAYGTQILRQSNAETHASTVVARRWSEKSKTCEYLIRNSWGSNCEREDGSDKYDGLECEDGHIWVERGRLNYWAGRVVTFN